MPDQQTADDNPSFKNEESTAAFNEQKARGKFGNEFVDQLIAVQEDFKGDWWQLALLVKNLEDDKEKAKENPDFKNENRLADWNTWSDTRHYRAKSKFERIHSRTREPYFGPSRTREAYFGPSRTRETY